jgi:hypothetical protein
MQNTLTQSNGSFNSSALVRPKSGNPKRLSSRGVKLPPKKSDTVSANSLSSPSNNINKKMSLLGQNNKQAKVTDSLTMEENST